MAVLRKKPLKHTVPAAVAESALGQHSASSGEVSVHPGDIGTPSQGRDTLPVLQHSEVIGHGPIYSQRS